MDKSHRDEIVEQFSQQAVPFTKVPGHLDAMELLVELARPTAADSVLDVACGPGLVACEFAPHSGRVTGIDITPAMIAEAGRRGRELQLDNLTWTVGDALQLPFGDDSFSLVVTRYSLHHFLEPGRVLAEMVRVCRPGGRVLVADVAMPPSKVAAYDRMELMRDPSHTHALSTEEFAALCLASGLTGCRQSAYGVEIELEAQLRASFPRPGDGLRLRALIAADVGQDTLGIAPRLVDDAVVYTVPIGVFVGRKGA